MGASDYMAIAAALTLGPFVAYHIVKLMTFAYYRAKHQAERHNQRESRNGLE